jgi:hypothetical protein
MSEFRGGSEMSKKMRKWEIVRVAKQLPYITEEDILRMRKDETTENDCIRIMTQRRKDWD